MYIQKILTAEISGLEVACFSSMNEAVEYAFSSGKGKIAVAINPEKIMSARRNGKIYEVLKNADIRYLDGIGTVKVAERKLNTKLSRVPGCELWQKIMEVAGERRNSVYLLGAKKEIVSQTKNMLTEQYHVNIVGCNDGYFDDDEMMIQELLMLQPDILSVAMGSPRQEIFMEKCRQAGLRSFMMGVGGTYNVYTGNVKRAPKVWCELNLEWLYRLIIEPSRFFRQVELIKFIYLSLSNKI